MTSLVYHMTSTEYCGLPMPK